MSACHLYVKLADAKIRLVMIEQGYPFLNKAVECLTGAESEFSNQRYNNTANRAYYACFQAAIAALQRAEIRPPRDEWSHEFVPSQFDGVMINRRHLYPTNCAACSTQRWFASQRRLR